MDRAMRIALLDAKFDLEQARGEVESARERFRKAYRVARDAGINNDDGIVAIRTARRVREAAMAQYERSFTEMVPPSFRR